MQMGRELAGVPVPTTSTGENSTTTAQQGDGKGPESLIPGPPTFPASSLSSTLPWAPRALNTQGAGVHPAPCSLVAMSLHTLSLTVQSPFLSCLLLGISYL